MIYLTPYIPYQNRYTKMHNPVLLTETLTHLDIQPTDIVIDATLGYGGHTSAILPQLTHGHLIGIDQDPTAIAYCQDRFKTTPSLTIYHDNFENISSIFQKFLSQHQGLLQNDPNNPTKILADLGLSSVHLDRSGRGFSFQKSEPLDMRMNTTTPMTAAHFLNTASAEDLDHALKNYGELYRTEKVIDYILTTRPTHPFALTDDLVLAIKKGFFFRNSRSLYMRTCAQVFQAIRMAVNDEVGVLTRFLENASTLLAPQGRIALITFHSIEDRIVKQFFASHPQFEMATKKVIKPNQAEIRQNSRSRSAKLRVYIKHPSQP